MYIKKVSHNVGMPIVLLQQCNFSVGDFKEIWQHAFDGHGSTIQGPFKDDGTVTSLA